MQNVQYGNEQQSNKVQMKLGGKSNMVSGSLARARLGHMNNQSDTGYAEYTGYIGYTGYTGYNDVQYPT